MHERIDGTGWCREIFVVIVVAGGDRARRKRHDGHGWRRGALDRDLEEALQHGLAQLHLQVDGVLPAVLAQLDDPPKIVVQLIAGLVVLLQIVLVLLLDIHAAQRALDPAEIKSELHLVSAKD